MKRKIYKKQSILLLLISSILILSAVFTMYVHGQSANVNVSERDKKELGFVTEILGPARSIELHQEYAAEILKNTINTIIRIIFSIAGIAIVIMLTIHGTRLIYAHLGGRVGDIQDGKERIKNIAMGAVILLMSYLILNFVNPQLLNPSLLSLSGFVNPALDDQFLSSVYAENCSYENGVVSVSVGGTFREANGTEQNFADWKSKKVVVFFKDTNGELQPKIIDGVTDGKFNAEIQGIQTDTKVVVAPLVTIDNKEYVGRYLVCGGSKSIINRFFT